MKYFFLPLFFFLTSCGSTSNPQFGSSHKPIILVSVAPYKKMVSDIVKESAEVVCIIPPHVDPHNWEPTYKDIDLLQKADLWFTIGEGFESRLLKKLRESNRTFQEISLVESMRNQLSSPLPQEVVNLSYNEQHRGLDNHFWLDPLIDIAQASIIKETVSKRFPEKASSFEENFIDLEARLLSLDKSIQISLSPYKDGVIVTSHGAYTYYCFRYNLYQLTIEPFSGKEPRAQELTTLVEEIKKKREHVLAVLLQPQHTNKAAKILAADLSLPVHIIDPYAEDYENTLLSLTLALQTQECL